MATVTIEICIGPTKLAGDLAMPPAARGVVLFAHGSGSSRHSPRNQFVAGMLNGANFGSLLLDLLTSDEEGVDLRTAELRFDIGLLAERLVGATDWLAESTLTSALPVGYFGASTGAGAALVAAAHRPKTVSAVVSRGGRPDLAADDLPSVRAPTLLIVGGNDVTVLGLNRQALRRLGSKEKQLQIIPEATHLFEEPGALEEVARSAADWFIRYLTPHVDGVQP